MPHELFCLSYFAFRNWANRFRIKFCTRTWNSFFSEEWVWHLEKQPNLWKWVQIKKKRPLLRVNSKLEIAGTKIFWLKYVLELWDCNRVGQILIQTFNVWPRPLFQQKTAKIRQKVIVFFIKNWEQIGPWFCDIRMM